MSRDAIATPRSLRPTATGAVAILLWSGLASLTAASGRVPPFELAALTFAIGGMLGLGVAAIRGRLAALRQSPAVWLVGVGGLFGYHALYFAALRLAPPAQAGLIAYLWPLLVVLLSATLPGQRLTARHLVGAMLGFMGTVVLLGGAGGGPAERHFVPGYALAFAGAFVWAGYSTASRRLASVPTEAVAGFCLATAALAGLVHVLTEATVTPSNALQWGAIVALGLGPVGAAFYAWDIGMKRGDVRLLGTASYAAPVLSTLLLVVAGISPPTLALAAACGLIVAGAGIAALPSRNRLPPRSRA